MFNKDSKSYVNGNGFSIFQTDAGTSPTADSSDDTITFTSSDNSVTITGNSTTDTIDFTVSSTGGAPDNAQYLTLALNGSLTAERVLTAGTAISFTDAGANSTLTINNTGVTSITGTANQVIASSATGAVTLSLPQDIGTNSDPTFDTVNLDDLDDGGVVFANSASGTLANDAVNFYWNSTDKTLSIGQSANSMTYEGSSRKSILTVDVEAATAQAEVLFHRHSASYGAELLLARSRGSHSVPTVVQNGDALGNFLYVGYTGGANGYVRAAEIIGSVSASGTVSNTSMPGQLAFYTVPDGSIIPARALHIESTKVITMDAYGTGIAHFSSSGVISSSLIVNADVDAAAAIARSKIAVGTADHVVINSGTGALSSEANLAVSRGGTGTGTLTANNVILGNGTSAVQFVAPGTSGNVLTSNGTTWTSAAPTGGGAPTSATYFVLSLDGTLTNERALAFNATNFSTTDLGAGNTYSVNTVQNIDTSATPTFQRLLTSGSTNQKFLDIDGTMDGTTDEYAVEITYTTNKAVSGNDYGLVVNKATDTASVGTSYLMDLQRLSSTKFRVDENGNLETSNITGTAGSGIRIDGGSASGADLKLRSTSHATPGNVQIEDNILFDGTIFKTSASSFTIRDQINRDILVANATDLFINDVPVTIENEVTINDDIFIVQDSSSGAVGPVMTVTTATHTALTGEIQDLVIDLSALKTYAGSQTVAQSRYLYINSPSIDGPNSTTLTQVSTVTIAGIPELGSAGMLVTNAIGFLLEQTTAGQNVTNAAGFVIYAPDIATGAPTFASCGSFLDGVVGMGTLSPSAWLDVRVPTITASLNDVVCLDGVTRYSGMYLGGSAINAVNNGTNCLLVDFGTSPTFSSNNSANGVGVFFRIENGFNYTGTLNGYSSTMQVNTTGGTASNVNAGNFIVNTVSGSAGAVTTARSVRTAGTFPGSQTITTYIGLEQNFNNSGASSTVTTGHYIKMNAPTTTGTVTDFDALLIEANAMSVSSRKTNLRILGDVESRIVGSVMIGEDSSPGHQLEVKDGNIAITNTGTAGELRLYEPSASGSNYTAFKTQAQAGNVTYTLPAADAAASGYSLTSDGAGTLSWTNVSGGGGSHALLSATHSDTVANAVSRGSIIIGNSTPAWTELTIGAANTVLKSDGTDVSWGTVPQTTWLAAKAADTNRASTTVIAADGDLDLDITWENSTKYAVEINVFCTNGGSATPDLEFVVNGPAITAGSLRLRYSIFRVGNTTPLTPGQITAFVAPGGSTGELVDMASSAEYSVHIQGSFQTSGTPGTNNLTFAWAQSTSNATNTTVQAGSWMRVSKVQ